MASNLGPKNSVLDVVPEFPEKNNNDKSYLEDDDENDEPVMILYNSKSSSGDKVKVPYSEGLTKSLIKSSESKTSK